MARIRTIKPEFWTSAQVMDLSIPARLLFIGLWNFCDDAGIHPASEKRLKAEVFPADDVSVSDVRGLIAELVRVGLLAEYAIDSESYWQVTGWHHQKIDQPTFKHPRPDGSVPAAAAKRRANRMVGIPAPRIEETFGERSPIVRTVFGEQPANTPGEIGDCSLTEGKGVESKGVEDKTNTDVLVVAGATDDQLAAIPSARPKEAILHCPVSRIVSAYHDLMPDNPRVKVLSDKRKRSIGARWREAANLTAKPFGYETVERGIEAWRQFFAVCAASDFLTGKTKGRPGHPPFVADIDFLTSPDGFAKCLENKYHREVA